MKRVFFSSVLLIIALVYVFIFCAADKAEAAVETSPLRGTDRALITNGFVKEISEAPEDMPGGSMSDALCSIGLLICASVSCIAGTQGAASRQPVSGHARITRDFIAMTEADPKLKAMFEKSIALAAAANPDHATNPVQSLNEYYAFLDWCSFCLPWDVLNMRSSFLYERLDQGVDYFYFLLDQPLPELSGKGFYYPSLQYYEPVASWIREYCCDWGAFLSTEASWSDECYALVCSDERFHMKSGWYADSNVWSSFNDWFSRKLSGPGVRPIASADIVAPADSWPQGIWKLDENSQIEMGVQLKSVRFYNAEDIIGPDSAYKDRFANGTLTHTFLDVNEYHRYHFPVSGTILEVRKISACDAGGGVYAWDAARGMYVLFDTEPGWQSVETRDCLIMDTEYGLVAILPIAMSQVSSCNWEDTVKAGAYVKAGDPMGYFLFGGSDIVMIFQSGAEFELTGNAHLLMGEAYMNIRRG